ncbi:MAG: hypothetical protein LBT80_08380 [Lactobacillaceae bacterium]|nr:hypothetical protein [Lactobacillaceae bacterium]
MNKKYKIAALTLAIAAVGTGAFLSQGTNAKYTTGGNGVDQARIAKWHIDKSSINLDLFSNEYTNGDDEVIVKSKTTDDVIAPGTSGSKEINFDDLDNGKQTEVAYAVKLNNLTVTNVNSVPLLFKYQIGTAAESDWMSGDGLKAALDNQEIKYDAQGNHIGETNNGKITIKWFWPFEKGGDPADTNLGVNHSETPDDGVALDLTYSVTQTD